MESVEEEIGNLGGIKESVIGHKLPNAEQILGGKATLSETDKESMHNFIEKTTYNPQVTEVAMPSISTGWIPINREEMGIRSIFYPLSWEFYIKAATVQAIKNWTSIDENQIEQLNSAFNDIVKTCVKIDTHTAGVSAGWRDINSWDRFWFILKIRELTFTKGESKIQFDELCPECNEPITYILNAESLQFDLPDQDLIDKYWNGSYWEINPEEYGVHGYTTIKLYTPKLGKDDMIIQWATAKIQANQKVDETFAQYLIWLINKPATVLTAFEQQVQKIYREYSKWSLDIFNFMTDVIKNLSVDQSERLKTICPNCSREVSGEVRFPNGIKSLFNVQNTSIKKFGSR